MLNALKNDFLPVLILVTLVACGGSSTPEPEPVIPAPDTTVNTFVIPEVLDVEPNTEITSDLITISGIDAAVSMSVSGCSYSKNQQSYESTDTTLEASDTLTFKITSSENINTTVSCSIAISQFSTVFSVTTRAELVGIEILVRTGSKDNSLIIAERLFEHDLNGDNLSELEVTTSKTIIPGSYNGVSYTIYASTEEYGNLFHNLYTEYDTNESHTHVILPFDSSYLFNDCKSVTIDRSLALEPEERSIGFFTSNRCSRISGRIVNTAPSQLSLDLSNESTGKNDLIYFSNDDSNNLLGYKLFNSDELNDEEIIDINSLGLNTNFNVLAASFDSSFSGSASIYSYDDSQSILRVGQHDIYEGNNSWVMNIADVDFSYYEYFFGFLKDVQYSSFSQVFESIPEQVVLMDDPVFFTEVNLVDNRLTWSLDKESPFETVSVVIEKKLNDTDYRWQLRSSENGELIIPEIDEIDTKVFLPDASIAIYLRSTDEVLNKSSYLSIRGTLSCSNDVCSILVNI